MSLTASEKKNYAWLLFKDGTLTQKASADRVGTSEQTVSKWKEAEGWDQKRRGLLSTREEMLYEIWEIFENTKNAIKQKGSIANSKDGDAMLKISATIKNLETEISISEVFEVGKQFIHYVQKVDFERAKEIIDFYDGFIKECLKVGRG